MQKWVSMPASAFLISKDSLEPTRPTVSYRLHSDCGNLDCRDGNEE